jgi:hypothetical protein
VNSFGIKMNGSLPYFSPKENRMIQPKLDEFGHHSQSQSVILQQHPNVFKMDLLRLNSISNYSKYHPKIFEDLINNLLL